MALSLKTATASGGKVFAPGGAELDAAEMMDAIRADLALIQTQLAVVAVDTAAIQAAAVVEAAKTLALKSGVVDVATHDYIAGTSDWVLSAAEQLCPVVTATNAGGAVIAKFGTKASCDKKVVTIVNGSGQALTCKPSDATGIVVASAKTAVLRGNGSDFVRVTPDI